MGHTLISNALTSSGKQMNFFASVIYETKANSCTLQLLKADDLPQGLNQVEVCELMKLHKSMEDLDIEIVSDGNKARQTCYSNIVSKSTLTI